MGGRAAGGVGGVTADGGAGALEAMWQLLEVEGQAMRSRAVSGLMVLTLLLVSCRRRPSEDRPRELGAKEEPGPN